MFGASVNIFKSLGDLWLTFKQEISQIFTPFKKKKKKHKTKQIFKETLQYAGVRDFFVGREAVCVELLHPVTNNPIVQGRD